MALLRVDAAICVSCCSHVLQEEASMDKNVPHRNLGSEWQNDKADSM